MALNLHQKQTECLNRMLNPKGNASKKFSYKILIYDEFCKNILAPLFHVKDLLKQRVTLRLLIDKIDKDRKVENECDIAPAVYFVQPTESNIQRIISLSEENGNRVIPNAGYESFKARL